MKKLPILMILLSAGCALANPPRSKFTIHVMDSQQSSAPVSNAVIRTGFTLKHDPWGTGKGEKIRIKKEVDLEGRATFEGNTIWGEHGGNVHAEGYYPQIFSMKYKKNRVLNRWEPWNPTIGVQMRKIKNPASMVYKWVERKQIPEFEEPVGFDLEKADWVSPYGKGQVSDFAFTASTNIAPKKGVHYILSFPNEKDGIQKYMPPQGLHSSFAWPYEAPADGYESGLDKYFIFHFPKVDGPPSHNVKDDKEVNYIFRVRTETDEEGNIVSACYGRIKGEIRVSSKGKAYFQYWFNPDSQSRSLESNKKPY